MDIDSLLDDQNLPVVEVNDGEQFDVISVGNSDKKNSDRVIDTFNYAQEKPDFLQGVPCALPDDDEVIDGNKLQSAVVSIRKSVKSTNKEEKNEFKIM